jgi:diphthamide biosynthesis protein 3
MADNIYEEVEIEDMVLDKETQIYSWSCPCGDRFVISLEELLDGEDVAHCPSCTLRIRVVYEVDALPELKEMEEAEESEEAKGEQPDEGGNGEAKTKMEPEAVAVAVE